MLSVTALDAWIAEVLVMLPWLNEDIRDLGPKELLGKYEGIMAHFGVPPKNTGELTLLCNSRNEIVHFLPRWLGKQGALPEWLVPLREKNLLLEEEHSKNELPEKLCSYRLAYWAWQTIDQVATEIVQASGDARSSIVGMLAGNFRWYEGVHSPLDLAAYDAQHNIPQT